MRSYLKFLTACAAFVTISSAAPLNAQGVFDLGALTSTITSNTAQQTGKPAGPAASVAAMTFKPSMDIRKQNVTAFVDVMKKVNAEAGAQIEQAISQIDLIEEIGKGIAPFGLRTDSIVDGYTLYMINAWMAANGRTDLNTKEQADGTKNMVMATFSDSPELAKLSDEDKQKFAEGMMLNAFLYDGMLQSAAANPEAMANVKKEVRTAAKLLSIDLDLFDMTANGLVRKKK
jgi:hypothetical protein